MDYRVTSYFALNGEKSPKSRRLGKTKTLGILMLLAWISVAAGCSSIFYGTETDLYPVTDPLDAELYINRQPHPPGVPYRAKRSEDYIIRAQKPGFHTEVYHIESELSPALALNLGCLTFAPVGILADLLAGGAYELETDRLYIRLDPVAPGEARRFRVYDYVGRPYRGGAVWEAHEGVDFQPPPDFAYDDPRRTVPAPPAATRDAKLRIPPDVPGFGPMNPQDAERIMYFEGYVPSSEGGYPLPIAATGPPAPPPPYHTWFGLRLGLLGDAEVISESRHVLEGGYEQGGMEFVAQAVRYIPDTHFLFGVELGHMQGRTRNCASLLCTVERLRAVRYTGMLGLRLGPYDGWHLRLAAQFSALRIAIDSRTYRNGCAGADCSILEDRESKTITQSGALIELLVPLTDALRLSLAGRFGFVDVDRGTWYQGRLFQLGVSYAL